MGCSVGVLHFFLKISLMSRCSVTVRRELSNRVFMPFALCSWRHQIMPKDLLRIPCLPSRTRRPIFRGVYTSSPSVNGNCSTIATLCCHQKRDSQIPSQMVKVLLQPVYQLLLGNEFYSPRYSVTESECKKYIFHICQLIAQHSDAGRQALINAQILPELSCLASSQIAIEVISACKVLKALAHTGTFRQDIISAGLKTSMEHITRYDSFL